MKPHTGKTSLNPLKRRTWHPRFARTEDGSVVIEGLFIIPALAWCVFALFTYWDAYRSINTVQKASYTISDMISRRMAPVNDAYLTGLRDTMDYLLDPEQSTDLRVTSVTWVQANNRFEVQWSKSPGAVLPELTTATLQPLADRIPAMADGDTVVVVETNVAFTPTFDVGLNNTVIRDFIVTRPRLAPRVCYNAC